MFVETMITVPDQAIQLMLKKQINYRDFMVWLLMSYYHQTSDYECSQIAWDDWIMIQSRLCIEQRDMFYALCRLQKHGLVHMPKESEQWHKSVPLHPTAVISKDHTLPLFGE